ncbi:unnamed protein product, partial [Rotaria sp. Silwood1]
ENELITHKSIVANKDYPRLLYRFVHGNGLKILPENFARNYPLIESYDQCLTRSSSSSNRNIFDKKNFFDFSSLVSTSSSTNSSNNMTIPYYLFITFSIFLRLPNYARPMLKNRSLPSYIIRLMLEQKESITNQYQDETQQEQHQDNFDMHDIEQIESITIEQLNRINNNNNNTNTNFWAKGTDFGRDILPDALTINSMQRIKRLAQEQITISTSLSLSFSSTIFLR